jgi:hypothetical protein
VLVHENECTPAGFAGLCTRKTAAETATSAPPCSSCAPWRTRNPRLSLVLSAPWLAAVHRKPRRCSTGNCRTCRNSMSSLPRRARYTAPRGSPCPTRSPTTSRTTSPRTSPSPSPRTCPWWCRTAAGSSCSWCSFRRPCRKCCRPASGNRRCYRSTPWCRWTRSCPSRRRRFPCCFRSNRRWCCRSRFRRSRRRRRPSPCCCFPCSSQNRPRRRPALRRDLRWHTQTRGPPRRWQRRRTAAGPGESACFQCTCQLCHHKQSTLAHTPRDEHETCARRAHLPWRWRLAVAASPRASASAHAP